MAFRVATGVIEFSTRGVAAVNNGLRSIGTRLRSVFSAPVLAGGGVLAAFFGGQAILKAAGDQIQALSRLDAVLRATGGAAGFTTRQMADTAGALQKVTLFGDEVTNAAQAILATFTNIRGPVFERTIELAQDMASLFEGDLSAAATTLGRALNDPVNQLTLLKRQGITLDDAFVKQIQDMVKEGKGIEAQVRILNLLEARFKGVARAVAETPIGRLGQLKNAIGDLGENIGVGFLQRITTIFGDLTSISERLGPIALQIGAAFGDALTTVGDLFSLFAGGGFGEFDTSKIENFIQGIRSFLVTVVPRIKLAIAEIGEFLIGIIKAVGTAIIATITRSQAAAKENPISAAAVLAAGVLVERQFLRTIDALNVEGKADELRKLIEDRLKNIAPIDAVTLVGGDKPNAGTRPEIAFPVRPDSGGGAGGAVSAAVSTVGDAFRRIQEQLLKGADTEDAQRAQEMIRVQNEQLKKQTEQVTDQRKLAATVESIHDAVRSGANIDALIRAIGMR